MKLIRVIKNITKLLLFLSLFLCQNTYSQTIAYIQTPNGNYVPDSYYFPEMTLAEISYYNNWCTLNYPNATFLNNSSATYNCHGYAWYMSQGGVNVWIGATFTNAEDIFWQDGSYTETTTQGPNQKVSYYPQYDANHSANTTSTNNIFDSKWGAYALMRHSYNYCPFWLSNSSLKFYYASNPIGVEDYIIINLPTTDFNINQNYWVTPTFVDEWPYGDYIVQWNPWKIEAFHSCDGVMIFEGSGSLINIPSLPTGYLWNRDVNGYVVAKISISGIDNDGEYHEASANIKILNVPNNIVTSGPLNSNTVWKGCVNLTGDVTVPTGITLTIDPGAKVIFPSNSSLIVNGTLNAINCQFGGDIGTWGSITFNGSSSSNSVITNSVIQNGVGIRCLNNANVTISNSSINHCTEGVYVYNSQPNISGNQIIEPVQNGININASGLSPLIQSNTITKTSSNPQYRQYQGVYLSNNSNGYIAKNDISGFYWGMYIGGGSDAYFTNYSNQTFTQNNRVINSRVGIGAGWGAYIFAGMWKSYGRNNSVYNNLNYDAYSYQSSNFVAECNWWGNDGAQTYCDGSSTLDVSFPLTYDPWVPQDNTLIEENELTGDESINQIITPDSSMILGILLELRGRSNEAISHYKQMIKNNRNADFALGRLISIMNRYNVIGIREYIESLLFGNNNYKPVVLTLLAGRLLEENKFEEAKILYNRIISDYPDSYFAVNARFEKFFAALILENNLNAASELLIELRALSLNDVDYLMRLQDAENQFVLLGTQLIEKPLTKQQINTELGKPDSYALNANYPNPFNPSTNIQFSIPEQSFVELKVFDILGNEVVNLVKQDMEPGNYSVVFNGSNLASGIYLYRLVSGSFFDIKKMMLVK